MLRQLTFPGLFLAAALAFLSAPADQLSASECGGPGVQECKRNEMCVNLIFYKHCTTNIDYWSSKEGFQEVS